VTFGLTIEKLLLILVIAAVLLGPERLPEVASQLARFTKWLRSFVAGTKDRVKEEMGDDFDEVDWSQLDPRRYDPRRIIADALLDSPAPAATTTGVIADRRKRRAIQPPADPGSAPFDSEAT